MGQYWVWINKTKREYVLPYEFGSGVKYLGQFGCGTMYSALMLLMTDTSSLGSGLGDPDTDSMPYELKNFTHRLIYINSEGPIMLRLIYMCGGCR